MATAIDQLEESCISASWDATGIPRALWGDIPSHQPMIDAVEARLKYAEPCDICECGTYTPRHCPKCEAFICEGCWTDHRATWCDGL